MGWGECGESGESAQMRRSSLYEWLGKAYGGKRNFNYGIYG